MSLPSDVLVQPDILPDGRLQHHKTGIIRGWSPYAGSGNWEPVFCGNCHRLCLYVPTENMTFAFYLCNECVNTWGQIAGVMLIPDEVWWEQVRQDAIAKQETAAVSGDISIAAA